MPFGKKDFVNLKGFTSAPTSSIQEIDARIEHASIDFDRIYKRIIEPAAEHKELELDCRRSDEAKESGMVHREMIRSIIDADVVIVDITLNNPNVFYELGIRHSLRRSTTVVIRNSRLPLSYPFNIAGMRAIEYDDTDDQTIEDSRKRLRESIKASFEGKDVDSLVHTLFNDILITRNAPPIMEQEFVKREVAVAPGRFVGYVTGDIARIKCCDAWVNPENTKMEMGRLHDDSISSTIRFLGARRNAQNYVVEDIVREELENQVDEYMSVEPGTVLMTGPGALKDNNKVRLLVHVAALHGEPAKGYLPVRDYPGCILRLLNDVEDLNNGKCIETRRRSSRRGWLGTTFATVLRTWSLDRPIESILIPLFGSRTTGQHPQDVADQLFRAASVFFEQNPDSKLKHIYFLAYTLTDKQYCDGAVGSLDRMNRLVKTADLRSSGEPLTGAPTKRASLIGDDPVPPPG